jgi:hypothetical protein
VPLLSAGLTETDTPLAGLVEPMLSVYVVAGGVVVVLLPPPQDANSKLNPIPSQAAGFQLILLMQCLSFPRRSSLRILGKADEMIQFKQQLTPINADMCSTGRSFDCSASRRLSNKYLLMQALVPQLRWSIRQHIYRQF